MTTDELDPFEPKEQIQGARRRGPLPPGLCRRDATHRLHPTPRHRSVDATDRLRARSGELSPPRRPGAQPGPATRSPGPRLATSLDPRAVGFALAFAVGAIARCPPGRGRGPGSLQRLLEPGHARRARRFGRRLRPDPRRGDRQAADRLRLSRPGPGHGHDAGRHGDDHVPAGRPRAGSWKSWPMRPCRSGTRAIRSATRPRSFGSAIGGQSVPVVVQRRPDGAGDAHPRSSSARAPVPPQDAQVTLKGGTFAVVAVGRRERHRRDGDLAARSSTS